MCPGTTGGHGRKRVDRGVDHDMKCFKQGGGSSTSGGFALPVPLEESAPTAGFATTCYGGRREVLEAVTRVARCLEMLILENQRVASVVCWCGVVNYVPVWAVQGAASAAVSGNCGCQGQCVQGVRCGGRTAARGPRIDEAVTVVSREAVEEATVAGAEPGQRKADAGTGPSTGEEEEEDDDGWEVPRRRGPQCKAVRPPSLCSPRVCSSAWSSVPLLNSFQELHEELHEEEAEEESKSGSECGSGYDFDGLAWLSYEDALAAGVAAGQAARAKKAAARKRRRAATAAKAKREEAAEARAVERACAAAKAAASAATAGLGEETQPLAGAQGLEEELNEDDEDGGVGPGNEVGSCCGDLGAKQVGQETVAGKVLVKGTGEGGNLGPLQRFISAVQYVPGEAKSKAEILRDLQISLGLLEVESEESSEEGEGDDEERFAEFLAYLIAAGRFDAANAPEAVRRFVDTRDKGRRMLEERECQLLEGAF